MATPILAIAPAAPTLSQGQVVPFSAPNPWNAVASWSVTPAAGEVLTLVAKDPFSAPFSLSSATLVSIVKF